MKLWDNHMHCHFSGDSDADPLDMIEKARQLGLSGITFTDHLDLDYKEEPHLFDLDLDACEKAMPALQKRLRLSLYFMALELGLATASCTKACRSACILCL